MSGEEIDVDELFMEGLSALIASLCAMHPMQLKSALEVVDRALDENVMPTQKLRDAYAEFLRVSAGNNPSQRIDKGAVQEAMKRWRLARDEADAIMEADATPERH